jgi:hypothetical protein
VKPQIPKKGVAAGQSGRNPVYIVGEIPPGICGAVADKQKIMLRMVGTHPPQRFIGKSTDPFQAVEQKQLSIYGYFHLPLDLEQKYRIEREYDSKNAHRKRKGVPQRIFFNGIKEPNRFVLRDIYWYSG